MLVTALIGTIVDTLVHSSFIPMLGESSNMVNILVFSLEREREDRSKDMR